jgi:hypothetical protein
MKRAAKKFLVTLFCFGLLTKAATKGLVILLRLERA